MDSAQGFRIIELHEESQQIEARLKGFSSFERGSAADIECRALAARLQEIRIEEDAIVGVAVTRYTDVD